MSAGTLGRRIQRLEQAARSAAEQARTNLRMVYSQFLDEWVERWPEGGAPELSKFAPEEHDALRERVREAYRVLVAGGLEDYATWTDQEIIRGAILASRRLEQFGGIEP